MAQVKNGDTVYLVHKDYMPCKVTYVVPRQGFIIDKHFPGEALGGNVFLNKYEGIDWVIEPLSLENK